MAKDNNAQGRDKKKAKAAKTTAKSAPKSCCSEKVLTVRWSR